MQFVDLPAQYRAYREEIDRAVAEVLASARFINGPQVARLEEQLASYVGRAHAVACASGTDALLLALMLLGIGPGDEVITTPFTFIATAETIALVGATPVFVDIDPETYNLDPGLVAAAVTPQTRAIVAVDIFGLPAAYGQLEEIAARHHLALIEDAAQSLGAELAGRKCGSFGALATTSFFPAKPLGCYGDGGMIFTDDADAARELRELRNHGQQRRYHHGLLGLNSRLDTLQAAILLAKLPFFAGEIDRRRQLAHRYSRQLAAAFVVPVEGPGQVSVYAQYSLRSPRRDRVLAALAAAGVPTAIHYPLPLHLQEVFRELGYREGQLPVAEQVCREIFSLPVHPFLATAEQQLIIETCLAAVEEDD
ncbi:MAG: DegT/DnrJ/EryC1/StrS family aminotransferase [Deltaproteobacteria bacterium]|nr:DegT/DnrJ/EryC1/StrS family aminotransferase [Deltaproteobacteria bacterium]